MILLKIQSFTPMKAKITDNAKYAINPFINPVIPLFLNNSTNSKIYFIFVIFRYIDNISFKNIRDFIV